MGLLLRPASPRIASSRRERRSGCFANRGTAITATRPVSVSVIGLGLGLFGKGQHHSDIAYTLTSITSVSALYAGKALALHCKARVEAEYQRSAFQYVASYTASTLERGRFGVRVRVRAWLHCGYGGYSVVTACCKCDDGVITVCDNGVITV